MGSKKFGFLFPGQGSQSVGMGFALVAKFPDFEPIFLETLKEADATIGFPISGIIKSGPAEKLKETEITQPALLIVSTAMSRWLKNKGISADIALGHSLGEYSALVHAEAISFASALKLVHLRGQLMQNAVPIGQGGMAALIGADADSAKKLCAAIQSETKKCLEPSVFNGPGQVVVSGASEAIKLAVTRAKEFGIRMATALEVSGPFHCSLLKEAGEKLGEALQKTTIQKPTIPVLSNVSGLPHTDPTGIRELLMRQVFEAVRWDLCVKYTVETGGFHDFVEVGSGKVLTGLVKKISGESKCLALDSIESLDLLAA